MPVDANLFNTLKAAEKKMLTDGSNWAQLVGAVTMYVKTLNDYDHKLQKGDIHDKGLSREKTLLLIPFERAS